MKLRWSERPVNDLIAIQRYIAQDNPKTAKKWVAKLRQRARHAAETALAGDVIVPKFNQEDIRKVFLGNYRIVYHVDNGNGILILMVFEDHQSLKL